RQKDVPWAFQGRLLRLRHGDEQGSQADGLGLAQAAAMHGDEARAETFETAEILVAGTLIDFALAPEFGFQWEYRKAVGFHAAVATALAHCRVDEGALGRIDHLAALAPAALLGGAGLVIEDHRDALELAQLALHGIQLATVVEGDDGREGGAGRVLVRLVRDQGDAFHTFCVNLLTELVDA